MTRAATTLIDNTDAEIGVFENLCERLGGFDERVSVEWLDGYMTALLASPRVPPLEEWLPRTFDDAWARTFADPEDQAQAMRGLRARWKVLAAQMDPEAIAAQTDVLRLSPLMFMLTDEERAQLEQEVAPEDLAAMPPLGQLWAMGFLDAVLACQDEWVDPAEDAEGADWYFSCMGTLNLLAVPGDEAEQAAAMHALFEKTLNREELANEAAYAAQDLRLYWMDHAPRPTPRGGGPARPQRPLPLR